jgi:Multicopper oxidase
MSAKLRLCVDSYRFRLVSISCDPNFTFSIDGHEMTIIEVDGNNVQPLVVDSIQIFAGEHLLNYAPHLLIISQRSTLLLCRKLIILSPR